MNNRNAKKAIMFIKGDDFYFIVYNLFVLLYSLGCTNKNRIFKDFKKLPYLIEFVANSKLTDILDRYIGNNRNINAIDKELLIRAYSRGIFMKNEIIKLLFALEKKKYITLIKDKYGNINLFLNSDLIPQSFFDKHMFQAEFDNAAKLMKTLKRISILNHETILTSLFENFGIKTWAI